MSSDIKYPNKYLLLYSNYNGINSTIFLLMFCFQIKFVCRMRIDS